MIFCAIIYIESDVLPELVYNSQESYNLGEWNMTQEKKEYLQKFWADIERAGDELRNQPMPELREEDFFLFKEIQATVLFMRESILDCRKYLTVFGILSEFKGKEENLKMLAQVLDAICTERFWALPAHVNFDALDEKTIDLFAAETAQSLLEIVMYWRISCLRKQ